MVDKNKIKKGNQYKFIPSGLSNAEKIVTVDSEPFYNKVVDDVVVKVLELFGLCPIKHLYEIKD